ncbi:hypothetical protein NBH19_08950 [Rhizobium sp. S95]|uniref:Uncharacterized protein n=1 Tax=Ciceribacter sichuanensis TaxID=2949647 RepID=A0AAJ1BWR1_9HYPH|nr:MULTISPECIES: hypothetical protein [unclassified Ciceribacter]MCM2396205.1 hypothetical protein [Ciceribacter sp. S95]MCO5957644.1 hypothetical protein [Ciceribacter sp. S101]
MTDRTFPEVTIPYGELSVKAMRITCAHCDGVAYFPHQTGFNRKPPVAAAQHFQNKGWLVGSGPRKDFCPLHASPAKRKGRKNMADTKATIADKPREMSRDDRRIINDKLDEVYGRDAYKSPWTDAAVAKDLGVPRDWVVQVRDQFFGPAGSNPLFDEFLKETGRMNEAFSAYADSSAVAEKAMADQKRSYAELSKRMDTYRALASKVEREIGR